MSHIERYTIRGGEKRYRVRSKGGDGQVRSKTFLRQKDAHAYWVEAERRASLGPLYQAPPQTLDEFLGVWLPKYALRVRPSTLRRVEEVLPRIRPLGEIPITSLRASDVEDQVSIVALRAPRQAQLALRLVKQVLAAAKEHGQSVEEAIFRVKPPSSESPEMRFLTWVEVEELAVNTVEPYGNLIRVAALTGMREGELFALRDDRVDLHGLKVSVCASAYQGELSVPKTKASNRTVDLSRQAAQVLDDQLRSRESSELGLVFPSPRGHVLNADNFRHRIFTPAVRRAGLTRLRFHDLRHTYAALMVFAGAHPKYLQTQMGHSSIRVTLDTYGHIYPDANRSVLDQLDAFVESSSSGVEVAEAVPSGDRLLFDRAARYNKRHRNDLTRHIDLSPDARPLEALRVDRRLRGRSARCSPRVGAAIQERR